MVSASHPVKKNESYNPYRKGVPRLREMSPEQRNKLIQKRPDYGVMICRCEEISKGEIVDALCSPLPVYTVDGVKRGYVREWDAVRAVSVCLLWRKSSVRSQASHWRK